MTDSEVSPWTLRGLYVFALTLAMSPMIDFVTAVWPLRPGDLQWRYGFLGLGAAYLLTPILGLVLAMAVAYWQHQATALKSLALLSTVSALALVPVLVVFPLDVLHMRQLSTPDVATTLLIGGMVQEAKHLGAFVVFVCLGFGGIRTARELVAQSRSARSHAPRIVSSTARAAE